MKVRNIITATFAMIVSVALSACAGSGNINNPRTSIYTTGGGQGVSQTTSSLSTDFDGNPRMKYAGVPQSEVIEKISKSCKLVSTDQFVNNGKTYVMENGARGANPYNEVFVMPAGKTIYVDGNGVPAYWPECGNRIGEVKTPVVASAPVPQVYVDNHQENHTSYEFGINPQFTFGGLGGGFSGSGVCIPRRERCDRFVEQRMPVISSCGTDRREERVCVTPIVPVVIEKPCLPPNPAGAYNAQSAAHGGVVYYQPQNVNRGR